MKKSFTFFSLTFLILCFSIRIIYAQNPGTLDPTFGNNGIVTTDFNSNTMEVGQSVVLQPDGKIVLAGYTYPSVSSSIRDFAVARYNVNGTLDNTFGNGGKVTTDFGYSDSGNSIAIQSDGKIIVAGSSNYDFVLARYNTNGTIDSTFGINGKVTSHIGTGSAVAYSIALQNDEKIIAAGYACFNDSIFGYDCAFALARYNTNGILDSTFGINGIASPNFGYFNNDQATAHDLSVQIDGKIIIAGGTEYNDSITGYNCSVFAMARYYPSGILDNTFGTNGMVTTEFGSNDVDGCNSISIQNNEKIVLAGIAADSSHGPERFAVARYETNGSLDNTFGINGKVITSIGTDSWAISTAIQSDGKIVIAGGGDLNSSSKYDFALARYYGDMTSIEEMQGIKNNLYIYPNPATNSITIENPNPNVQKYFVSIKNIQGQEVLSEKINFATTHIINISGLRNGEYIITLLNGNENYVNTFVVQKQ